MENVAALYCVLLLQVPEVLGTIRDPGAVCYGDLGCFSMLPPWNRTVDREGNMFFTPRPAPAPNSPEFLNTSVVLYTRVGGERGRLVYARGQLRLGSHFQYRLPNYLIVHGYSGSGDADYLQAIKTALLRQEEANVFMVTWATLYGADDYAQSVSDTRVVGAEIARIIMCLRERFHDSMFFHLLGHSLGGQICGYAGKAVIRRGHRPVERITGMDPAGIGFRGLPCEARLDAGDAMLVDAVHTDTSQLGTDEETADVDFLMNGGNSMPECADYGQRTDNKTAAALQEHVCSHIIACNYTALALVTGDCRYWGVQAHWSARGRRALTRACWLDACSALDDPLRLPARGRVLVDTRRTCTREENEFLQEYKLLRHAIKK